MTTGHFKSGDLKPRPSSGKKKNVSFKGDDTDSVDSKQLKSTKQKNNKKATSSH